MFPKIRMTIRLLIVSLCCLVAATAVRAQSAAIETESMALRQKNAFNLHLAVGATNGMRLGVRWYAWEEISPELSFGYVRLLAGGTNNHLEEFKQNALALSAGLNYNLFADNEVTPFFSLLLTHTWAIEKLNNYLTQRRISVTITTGAEMDIAAGLSCFLRMGPSLHFLSQTETRRAQAFLHFDAGLGWTF